MNLDLSILFNPEIFEFNLLDNHSDHKNYLSLDDYKNNKTNETLLNGTWKVIYQKVYDASLLEYAKVSTAIADLKDVEVPLSIELQGFARPQYVNVQYPFDGYNDGKIGEDINVENPVIVYLKDLIISEEQLTRRLTLNFKGFESGLFLYINGEFVGYSENLYLDSEFDVTRYLKEGVNRIAAYVFKYTSSSWLLDQDFMRFSGIFRDVVLCEYPLNYISDIDGKFELSRRDGKMSITLKGKLENCNAHIELFDEDNNLVFEGETVENQLYSKIKGVIPWSAELPYLYHLKISLYKDGKLLQICACNIGFKDVRIEDGILKFNGQRMILNGINRHEWNQSRGRNVTNEDMEFDAKYLKKHNVNSVRTSHYPNASYWYEVADKYGLYLVDECCLESHGSWTSSKGINIESGLPFNNEKWKRLCINKVIRMYQRDKLHPSIFMWSLGNEASVGEVFLAMKEALKRIDSKLIVHYEGSSVNEDYEAVSDVYARMYVKPKDLEKLLKVQTEKPVILSEYAHAMGNSLGNMDEYISLIYKHKNFQGGFIWDYIDQGLLWVKDDGRVHLCYGGDFHDKPNDRNFCCNGVIPSDRKKADMSSKGEAMKYHYQKLHFKFEHTRITIINDYLFKDTSDLNFILDIYCNGHKLVTEQFAVKVGPGQKKVYPIKNLIEFVPGYEYLYQVRAVLKNNTTYAEKGHIVAEDENLMCGMYKEDIRKGLSFKVVDGNFNLGIHGANYSYLFAKTKIAYEMPGLISIKVNGEEYLSHAILPSIFRPFTDNDYGNDYAFEQHYTYGASKMIYADNDSFSYKIFNHKVVVSYDYYLFKKNSKDKITMKYHVYGDGTIRVEVSTEGFKNAYDIPTFCARFVLPLSFERFSYYGLGKCENYPDRLGGAFTGLYYSTTRKEMTPYIRPQECGNHEKCRFLILNGKESRLKFVCHKNYFAFKYLSHSEFEIENASHQSELPAMRHCYLNIIGYNRGVGGDDSWGAPVHKKYTIDAKNPLEFSFLIRPMKK